MIWVWGVRIEAQSVIRGLLNENSTLASQSGKIQYGIWLCSLTRPDLEHCACELQ